MKTYTQYIDAWKQRIMAEEKQVEAERRKAFSKAQKAAAFLAKKYNVDKVVLFGSLIKGSYHKGSDIDIAVAGLPPKYYFRAIAEAEELINAKVDLKPIEGCRGLIRDRIEKGLILYEKNS